MNFPINKYIDHTILYPYASSEDIKKVCDECREYNFMMVAVNSVQVKLCKKLLEGTDVHVGAAIGFPLGQTAIDVKAYETKKAIEDGADEIDYVINMTELKNKNYAYIQREMEEIVSLCKESKVISKVIFENCYLHKDEIIKLCEIAKAVGPDFIKTSTGFGPSGATVEDVKLMKETVGNGVKVKAAGGIRDYKTFTAMIEAGAERIGTSKSIDIMKEAGL